MWGKGYQLGKAEKEMSYSKNYVVFLGIPFGESPSFVNNKQNIVTGGVLLSNKDRFFLKYRMKSYDTLEAFF